MLSFKKIFYTSKPKQHLAIALSFSLLMLPIQLQALPAGQRVMAGSASFDQTLNKLKITTSNKAIINYNSFNIDTKEGVLFVQPSVNSVVLNRVIQANPSSILGSLNANGNVFLVNPAGIFFGANSVVNANSFLATTLNISDENFLNGNYQFQQMRDMAQSYIIQKGSISVSPQGFVVLASPFVSSEGSIMAKAGHVTIGATDNFYIQFDSGGLIRYDYQKNATDDKPIVMPKAYADSLMEDVLNTDKISQAVHIVQNGDTIELVGGSGTAMISGTINTDATEDATAGTIEVQAQNNALLLNHATLQSNALLNGNGGTITVYGDIFDYGDIGASLIARGGTLSGDGGEVELSAEDQVLFSGSFVDLYAANGQNGQFIIDPDYITIDTNSYSSGADLLWQADKKITVNENIVISSRTITGSDSYTDLSSGDSGDITLQAPEIELNSRSALLSFANNGYTSGNILLEATSNTLDLGTLALSKISINGATLQGEDITLVATSNAQNIFDSEGDNDTPISYQILDTLLDNPISPMAVSVSKTDASIAIANGSNLEGNTISIQSNANSDASTFGIFSGVAIGYGEATASAVTTVSSGATINATGNVDIGSNAVATNSVKAYTVNLGEGRGSTVDLTLAYTKTDTTSTTTIENGATVHTTGDMSINALASKNINTSASAGAYDDGTLGAAVAISNSASTTCANVGGEIQAKKLSVIAITENELLKTASSAAVGSGFVVKYLLSGANNLITGAQNFLTSKKSTANSQSGSTTSLAISAALSYSEHLSDTTASIADGATITTTQDIGISATNSYPIDVASGSKGVKSSATATIDSNDEDKKENSVAGAIAITQLSNTANAYIGKNAVVNASGNIDIIAKLYMPYEITWGQITQPSDIASYANGNLGIQDGFFTTWAQSSSQGTQVGAAGSVNFFHMTNDTQAYIDTSSKINQNISNYGLVRLLALTDIQTMNLSGVFGFKVLGSSGESGIGGSYLDVSYDDTTQSLIKDGAKIRADALTVVADSSTKNISIAEAGTNAEKYGIAGTFSYLNINNETHALIQNAEIMTLNSIDNRDYINGDVPYASSAPQTNLYVKAYDYSKLLNISGGLIKAQNIGIGVSASLNDITRNTSSLIDTSNISANGNSYMDATNDGLISAWSLAGVVNTDLGSSSSQTAQNGAGEYGIGVSGDVSINNITDTTIAKIKDSTLTNNSHITSLSAKDESTIKSYSGSVALSLSSDKSVGLAGSYSQNTLTNSVSALIENSILNSASLTVQATNTGAINAYSASGSLQPVGAGIAGSVSINKITNPTTASITSSSTITTSGQVDVSSADTPTINTIAGSASFGGKAGIGASFAYNAINDNMQSDITDSKISASGISVSSTQTSIIQSIAASLGGSINNMAAAIAVTINNINNDIKSWISGTYNGGITTTGDITISSNDNSQITARSGEISGSGTAGFGASVLYNTITNDIKAYLDQVLINVDTGNILIKAKSDKTITAQSAGGTGAGTLAVAGGVIINTIDDIINAYLSNSEVSTKHSIALQALENNIIDVLGGTLSGAGTLGIGGTVVVNTFQNTINAYLSNSKIEASGQNSINTLKDDGSSNSESIRGIDILAKSSESLSVKTANISGGGTASIGASVSVNSITDTLKSYIDNSRINETNLNPNSSQSVRVRAQNQDDISILGGGLAIGGSVGANGTSDTTLINNISNAYINASLVKAINLVEVKNTGYTTLNSKIVSGAGAGSVGVAGNVEVINIDNTNFGYISDSSIFSESGLNVMASDTTNIGTKRDGTRDGILVGSLSVGGVAGVGGSVIVTTTKQNAQAHVDDSSLNAKGATAITSTTTTDVKTYAASGALGYYVGAGGAITINTINATSKAYTATDGKRSMLINQDTTYQNPTQSVAIDAQSYSRLDSTPGVISGGALGASGSIDIGTIRNSVFAKVGNGVNVYSGNTLLVQATSNKIANSNVVAFGGGALGVSGAVSIININNTISDDSLDASKNTKDSVNSIVGKSQVDDQLGDSQTALTTKAKLDAKTTNSNVNSEFDQTTLNQSIYAGIGSDGSILTTGSTTINATDIFSVQQLTGSGAAGVAGIGGAVSLTNIGANDQAIIETGASIDVGSLIINSSLDTTASNIKSYAAAAGVVGLGAAVSQYALTYTNNAYIDDESHITLHGDIAINSSTNLVTSSKAYGTSVGAGAVGLVKATLKQSGTTQSFLGENITLDQTNGNLDMSATYISDLDTYALAGAAGIISGIGALSILEVTPTLTTLIGDGSNLESSGDLTMSALAQGELFSQTDSGNFGGVVVGVSKATASWKPTVNSIIGSNGNININALMIHAYENTDTSGNFINNQVETQAFSAIGSLIGGQGSITESDSDSNVKATINTGTTITSNNQIDIQAKSYSRSQAYSNGYAFAVLASGLTSSSASNKAAVNVNIGTSSSLSAQNDISLLSSSKHTALATSKGGVGGLLSGGGTKSTVTMTNNVNVTLNNASKLFSNAGAIIIQAIGELYAKAYTDITTAGAITANESEADTIITQNVDVSIGSNAELEAQNIDILARVNGLQSDTSAKSKTIAANSTSKAYANSDITSNAKVTIHSSAKLTGHDAISIKAIQDNIYAHSTAKATIDAGVTGSLIANAHNDLNLNADVQIDALSSLITKDLYVEAYTPQKSAGGTMIYDTYADAEANTVVYWVLTEVEKLVKTVSKIPIIGWVVKWVWKTVKEWVKHILNSDASSITTGDFASNSNIIMNGDIHQITSQPQLLTIANDGTITTSGEISGYLSGDDVIINDLINHDQGKIVLKSNGSLEGSGNIYLNNTYSDVTITNNSNKNLVLNAINTISDNANEPNIAIYADDGGDYSQFNFYAENPSHTLNIFNLGTGDISLNAEISNYGGDTTLTNNFGNIYATSSALIKTENLSLLTNQGGIGTSTNRVEIELQKSDSDIPYINSQSLGATYLGLSLSEFLDDEPTASYTISKAILNRL